MDDVIQRAPPPSRRERRPQGGARALDVSAELSSEIVVVTAISQKSLLAVVAARSDFLR